MLHECDDCPGVEIVKEFLSEQFSKEDMEENTTQQITNNGSIRIERH